MNTVKQQYVVEVKVLASLGQVQKVRVSASGQADAIVQASLALDAAGITHWDLVKVVPALN
jgi:hypothetical protein